MSADETASGSAIVSGGAAMIDAGRLDWDKGGGLIPAIVQDAGNGAVLMLGYMNRDALTATLASRRVTFWSRSKQRLWTKGESSGNYLELRKLEIDCDGDTLLILAAPDGPACHIGTATCWGPHAPQAAGQPFAFLAQLSDIIRQRIDEQPEGSYTSSLIASGTRRIAQKVGEEGLELALAAVAQSDEDIIGEAADLVFHATLLLEVKGLSLERVIDELRRRHAARVGGPGSGSGNANGTGSGGGGSGGGGGGGG
jgi:phosphoribosyl-ATP pyrophosphohydrolase/phosphoribosyl-AMP cyclohydrolase